MEDLWRDFGIRETGTGQQVGQLHDRYMMMMMIVAGSALETSGCNYHHIQEERDPHLHRCENLKSCKKKEAMMTVTALMRYFRIWSTVEYANFGAIFEDCLMNIRIMCCFRWAALAKCTAIIFCFKFTHEGFNGLDVFLSLVLHFLQ